MKALSINLNRGFRRKVEFWKRIPPQEKGSEALL